MFRPRSDGLNLQFAMDAAITTSLPSCIPPLLLKAKAGLPYVGEPVAANNMSLFFNDALYSIP